MVTFNKKAAVLALVAEGVTSPKQISEKILEKYGQVVSGPTVSTILYNHRRASGISMRRRRRRSKSTLQVAKQSPAKQYPASLETVSGAHLLAAVNFVRDCGGDVKLAIQAVELVKQCDWLLPVQNEG